MSLFHIYRSFYYRGGQGYSPDSVSDLEYWYDASQIEGLADGAEIVSLADLSRNGNTLTPLSAARRPFYETNEITGNDAELFIDNETPVTDQGPLSPSASTSTNNPTFFSAANGAAGFNGYAAEWFGYSRALTNIEINRLTGGLGFGIL